MKQLNSRGETILKYIGSHSPIIFKSLRQRFPRLNEKDLKATIDILTKKKFVSLPNADRLFYGHIALDDLEISITYTGQVYLEERSRQKRQPLITITVTVVTNLIIVALKWLFPLLKQWLSHILERISSYSF